MDPKIREYLLKKNIQYLLFEHKAVFTVSEAKIHCAHIPGSHCKNLFLKNKKTGEFYLVTFPHDERLDLKKFRKMVNAPKIRFADKNDLFKILGINPGAVSPLGLINDVTNSTTFIVDEKIWWAAEVCCHPNINAETLKIPGKDFRKLIKSTGNKIQIENLPFSESSEED